MSIIFNVPIIQASGVSQGMSGALAQSVPTSPRALVVERDTLLRISERLLLNFGGIQVVATDDGSHAEELLEDECRSVDLLVIDYDLAPALRENLVTALARSGRRPAILFVAENENDVEPCTWTASESIERPFSPGEFVARAKSLVI